MKCIPKITVIIPCLNAKNTIQKTFDSLKNQNYPNLECIVVDGGSTDGTNEILDKEMFTERCVAVRKWSILVLKQLIQLYFKRGRIGV